MKQLWVLVGGNGAGKTTFYEQMLRPFNLPFINADNIAKVLFSEDPEGYSYEAAKFAEKMRDDQLLKGTSFCFETVFSHPSKVDFIARAKALGYQIILVVIHVEAVELNLARINERVKEGGHSVPDEKVVSRIPRMLENVKKAIPLCDQVRVLDNSSLENPFLKVLTIKDGARTKRIKPLPTWANGF
jgi:predicted ABC-type ATPase